MKKTVIRTISIMLVLVLSMLAFAGCGDKDKYEQSGNVSTTGESNETTTNAEVLPEDVNPLTGKADLSASAKGGRPIAIMVENSPAARPQWGLTTPDIVLEGVVEGGITRMMWIYADAEDIPSKVGPVRSARHDYVEIAKGMNAIFVHWGGSDEKGYTLAYPTIKNLGVNNVDGLTQGSYFFRDNTRNTTSEHRGCTSGDRVINAISKLGYKTTQTVKDWAPYKASVDGQQAIWGDNSVTGACKEIKIVFSSGYVHTFKYNQEEKRYYNYLNDKAMTDGNNGKQMAVENVLVAYSPISTLGTGKGHKEWNLELTRGEGFYVSNGVGQKVYWSKDGKSGALKFTSVNGQPLSVNSGQTWIGIVPDANRSLTTVVE